MDLQKFTLSTKIKGGPKVIVWNLFNMIHFDISKLKSRKGSRSQNKKIFRYPVIGLTKTKTWFYSLGPIMS